MKNLFQSFKEKDFWNNINLHIHTNLSDGKSTLSQTIEKFKALKYFSITDHNCVEAYQTAETKNLPNIIVGVEFDCWYKGVLVHILGYGMDINNEEFQKLLAKNEKSKRATITRLLEARNTQKVIEIIKNAGGIAILAHPACYWCINLDKFIHDLTKLGLDGVECYYPYKRHRGIIKFHFANTVNKIAEKYNLIKTGGTDEH